MYSMTIALRTFVHGPSTGERPTKEGVGTPAGFEFACQRGCALLLCRFRRRICGSGAWNSELQRLQRIDQSGAEVVVAVARRQPPCARGQDAADVGWG